MNDCEIDFGAGLDILETIKDGKDNANWLLVSLQGQIGLVKEEADDNLKAILIFRKKRKMIFVILFLCEMNGRLAHLLLWRLVL